MRKKLIGGVAVAAIGAIVAGVLAFGETWDTVPLPSRPAGVDLSSPDAVIRTKALSRLPADLLRVPLLHDLLSEDFLFYYDNSEGRLGLKGALRRIAYEHDITLTDKVIRLALDEPADVALWRGKDGSLKYYALSMTRGQLARIIESAAKIAMKDQQLVMVGQERVEGKDVPLYALEYTWNRKMLFASRGDRVVVFSDPGMVLTEDGSLTENGATVLHDLLSSDKAKQRRLLDTFSLGTAAHHHSIAVKVNFLSFHYQHFFPTLKALRFDFGGEHSTWSTQALLAAVPQQGMMLPDGGALWPHLPGWPGACAALPVDWPALASSMKGKTALAAGTDKLTQHFKGSAAVCWYANSRLSAPLFVTHLKQAAGADSVLDAYFAYAIRNKAGEAVSAAHTPQGDTVWESSVEQNNMHAMLARSGDLVYFSPDAALVQQALAVAHKRQPAMSDSWRDPQASDRTVVILGPAQLAKLAEREISISLPDGQDTELRSAAHRYLLPRLAAITQYQPVRLTFHDTPKQPGWVRLDWQEK